MAETRPHFWAPQTPLTPELHRFLQLRLERALAAPRARTLLAWPTALGAPVQRRAHPEGVPEPELMNLTARMVKALGVEDPSLAWREDLAAFPDTASPGPTGWRPHDAWASRATRVSLRTGVTLLAMTGQPEDDRFPLGCGVALFNCALFHESHEALETLRRRSGGGLQQGLQGLILLACGYYHQQCHHAAGMRCMWMDAVRHLRSFKGELDTPWGRIEFSESMAMAAERLEWLEKFSAEDDWARFWETPSPEWEFA